MKIGRIDLESNAVFGKMRVQLGGALLIAGFVPYILRPLLDSSQSLANLQSSLVGTLLAIFGGHLSYSQASQYPGVRSSYGVIPSFAISYGIILAAFFFLRIDYSRLHFFASFVLCLSWYFILRRGLRDRRAAFGVVPFGRATSLIEFSDCNWVLLDEKLAHAGEFDAIVADLHADIPPLWERFLADRALRGIPVLDAKQVKQSLTGRVEIEHLSENNLGSLIPGIAFDKLKRAMDLLTALVLAPFIAIALLPFAVAIKLESPGPVIFRQRRVGYRGEIFTVLKLRTMRIDNGGNPATDLREVITTQDDARVTRCGALMRKYRIDELPQVFNVIKGEMSWIGPRPEAVPLSEWYERELPFYRYRHIVRPGLTGWAQVNQGHVAEVADVLWKLHYDFYYIRNFSIWLDLIIIGRTIRTVMTGFGHK